MKERTVKRYICDYCRKGFWRKGSALVHEKFCGLNVNRECWMCKENGLDFTPAPLLDLVLDCGCDWKDVMRAASGCPLCTLGAVMRANKEYGLCRRSEEYIWFDYKDELKKFEDARRPSLEYLPF